MPSAVESPRGVLLTELKVVGAVLALLLLVEIGLQAYEPRLSIDIQHLQSFGAVAQQVRTTDESHLLAVAQSAPYPPQILFLGNSTTREGLDRDAFLNSLGTMEPAPELVALHPDNSRISEWTWLYQNFLAEQGRAPDVLVLGFAKEQLRDAPSKTPDRIARFYDCNWQDIPNLAREDVRGVEGWSNFALSRYSAIIANRERVERRILGSLIPHYQETSNVINNRSQPRELLASGSPATYSRLAHFVDLARLGSVQLVVVAMPVQEDYALDPELTKLFGNRGVSFVDCRHVPGVTSEMIPDGLHLTPAGATLYSEHLASQIALPQLIARRERQLAPESTPRWASQTDDGRIPR